MVWYQLDKMKMKYKCNNDTICWSTHHNVKQESKFNRKKYLAVKPKCEDHGEKENRPEKEILASQDDGGDGEHKGGVGLEVGEGLVEGLLQIEEDVPPQDRSHCVQKAHQEPVPVKVNEKMEWRGARSRAEMGKWVGELEGVPGEKD